MVQARRERYVDGVLVEADLVDVPDEVVNEQALNERANAALTDLRTLANSSGTMSTAQLSTAVRSIARALLYLIRLYLRRLDATD